MQFTMYHHAFVVIAAIVIAFIGAKKCKLGRLLELYDMAKEAKQ